MNDDDDCDCVYVVEVCGNQRDGVVGIRVRMYMTHESQV